MNRNLKALTLAAGAAGLMTGATAFAGTQTLFVDLTGFESWGGYANPANSSISIPVSTDFQIIDIEWVDVAIEAFSPSWLSEFTFSVNDSVAFVDGFWDARLPGAPNAPGVHGPGSASFNDATSFIGGPFTVTTGDLYIEVYESFTDGASPDGVVLQGGLLITYIPTPGALALFGLGGLAAARRRR